MGTSTAEWILGGKFLQKVGWYDIGGMRSHFVEIIGWDPSQRAFRSWYFSESGESGRVTMTSSSPDEFMMNGNIVKEDGSSLSSGGSAKVINDKLEWTWYEDDPSGRSSFKGTSMRKGKKVKLETAGEASPAMAALAPLVGSWKGTTEMISPGPEKMAEMMKEMMPDYEGEYSPTSKGEDDTDFILGGTCLRKYGWFEMMPGMKSHMLEYIYWDPQAKKFHSFTFNDAGEWGEGWITPGASDNTFDVTWSGTMQGEPANGSGSMTFDGDDQMSWTWSGTTGMGQMEVKGTATK